MACGPIAFRMAAHCSSCNSAWRTWNICSLGTNSLMPPLAMHFSALPAIAAPSAAVRLFPVPNPSAIHVSITHYSAPTPQAVPIVAPHTLASATSSNSLVSLAPIVQVPRTVQAQPEASSQASHQADHRAIRMRTQRGANGIRISTQGEKVFSSSIARPSSLPRADR